MESIWTQICNHREKRPALDRQIEADVAVIGGGMAGILTAWQLEQAGVRTVVLEADQIGQGQTKNTTAKITVQFPGYVFYKNASGALLCTCAGEYRKNRGNVHWGRRREAFIPAV